MTEKKIKRVLNCLPSAKTEQDWNVINAKNSGLLAAPAAIPASKDLRESWWKINDQGSSGSCVGWASVDGVIRWHFVKAGRVSKSTPLSPRFTWMASKETDEFVSRPTTFIEATGTSLKAALDVARNFGTVEDSVLPFKSSKLFQSDENTFYALASQLKIASYVNLGTNLNDWKQWLAVNGPILVRLNVDATWDNAKATNGNLDTYDAGHTGGGHAVALVGYTSSRFIVRNSWGTTNWGDKGFGFASMAYAQAAFTEAYGVSI